MVIYWATVTSLFSPISTLPVLNSVLSTTAVYMYCCSASMISIHFKITWTALQVKMTAYNNVYSIPSNKANKYYVAHEMQILALKRHTLYLHGHQLVGASLWQYLAVPFYSHSLRVAFWVQHFFLPMVLNRSSQALWVHCMASAYLLYYKWYKILVLKGTKG